MFSAVRQQRTLHDHVIVLSSVTDINECDTGTPCNTGACNNNDGSFDCDCRDTGFDGPTCSNGKLINKPHRRTTNNVVSEQVRHKPGCTSTEKS